MTSQYHIQRLNTVFSFIENNLHETLSLEYVSDVAAYSPFHFHRVFRFITGETILQYVTRLRLERSALMLAASKDQSIKNIYLEFGFTSHAAFTKAFKKYYGVSPSQFRHLAPVKFRRIRIEESKNGQTSPVFEKYICAITELQNWSHMNLNIEVKTMPEMHLAAVASIGIQGVETAYNQLLNWATAKGLFPASDAKMVSVYHDSFKTTAPDKVRIHACMLLKEPVTPEGEVFNETLLPGKYIVGSTELTLDEFEKAWTSLFLWMNENGYQFRRSFPYEIYYNNYKEHPEGKTRVEFYIPIL